jgi:hypothetical protein
MRTTSRIFAGLALVVATFLGSGACDRDTAATSASANPAETHQNQQQDEAASAQDAEKDENPYSPFGVQLGNGETFELISFKDVGLKTDPSTSRKMLFEAVAQSIAYQLKVDDQFDLQPRVIYDEALADPNNHTFCEKNRLYVDIWHGTSPERWGYSLWSGCSESQQFAWKEIEDERAISKELNAAVEPLANGIVESLAKAAEEDCYRQAC